MENFYYDAIYVLHDPDHHTAKAVALRRMKAKIVRLNTVQQRGVLLINGDPVRIVSEDLSLHYLKSLKRQKARTARLIYDQDEAPE
jgi:hypothetical protein